MFCKSFVKTGNYAYILVSASLFPFFKMACEATGFVVMRCPYHTIFDPFSIERYRKTHFRKRMVIKLWCIRLLDVSAMDLWPHLTRLTKKKKERLFGKCGSALERDLLNDDRFHSQSSTFSALRNLKTKIQVNGSGSRSALVCDKKMLFLRSWWTNQLLWGIFSGPIGIKLVGSSCLPFFSPMVFLYWMRQRVLPKCFRKAEIFRLGTFRCPNWHTTCYERRFWEI